MGADDKYMSIDEHGELIADIKYINDNKIESIDIPETLLCKQINENVIVTSISKYCFANCNNIVTVNIPVGVKIIDKWAFYNCGRLKNVNIKGTSLMMIARGAFASCISLTDIKLPVSLKVLKDHCFAYSGLEIFTMPPRAIHVPDRAFIRCYNLKKVIIHDNVSLFGDGAFYECSNLHDIKMPEKLLVIKNACFGWCDSIPKYNFHNRLARIGNWAFIGNDQIETIELGNNITQLETNAFIGCNKLTKIVIDLPEDKISGSPWGADEFDTTVIWTGEEKEDDIDDVS